LKPETDTINDPIEKVSTGRSQWGSNQRAPSKALQYSRRASFTKDDDSAATQAAAATSGNVPPVTPLTSSPKPNRAAGGSSLSTHPPVKTASKAADPVPRASVTSLPAGVGRLGSGKVGGGRTGVKEARMHKRGQVNPNWVEQLFTLDFGKKQFTVFDTRSGMKRKVGHWQLDGRCTVALPTDADDYKQEANCFTLTRGAQKLIMRADSGEQMQEWIDNINECCAAGGCKFLRPLPPVLLLLLPPPFPFLFFSVLWHFRSFVNSLVCAKLTPPPPTHTFSPFSGTASILIHDEVIPVVPLQAKFVFVKTKLFCV
jgi:hypothetical protein